MVRTSISSTAPADASLGSSVMEAVPLYQRIADALRSAIEHGTYPIGALLPTEAELCVRHAASRHTIREALRRLAELGLIERRQGAGSRVIATAPRVAYVHTVRSLSELFSYTRDTTLEIVASDRVTLTPEEAKQIGAPAESQWLRLTGIRWTADRADRICHVRIYVHSRFTALLKDIPRESGPIYALIEARSGERVAEALQEISARPMPPAAARAVGVRTGSPAMLIIRRYLDASGGPMLVAVNWHKAEFTCAMRLKRDGNASG